MITEDAVDDDLHRPRVEKFQKRDRAGEGQVERDLTTVRPEVGPEARGKNPLGQRRRVRQTCDPLDVEWLGSIMKRLR